MADSPKAGGLTVSIDAMGGDHGPAAVVSGLDQALKASADLRFVLHGPEAALRPLLARRGRLGERCEIRHAEGEVGMSVKPREAVRGARRTSMWSALDAAAKGEAQAVVSCGNTGALMLMAMQRLKAAPGVERPAIAVFWPSRLPQGYTIMLDAGAGLSADARTLTQFAAMGAAYAETAFDLKRPGVGLLNVGSEESKGDSQLRLARERLEAAAAAGGYEWRGFVEGGDLCGDGADVIVTDGFTGNVALKTAEGVASFIGEQMKASFMKGVLSRLAGLMALKAITRMRRKIDPRRANGGVFLGLNGAVVKSHGSADATGVAAAVLLAARMARSGFADSVARRVAALEAGDVRTAAQ